MTRLLFRLHDFTRIIWHSAHAKEVWEPRIARITRAWDVMERYAVVSGVHPSCLTFYHPHHFVDAAKWAARNGLVLFPLSRDAIATQYSASTVPLVEGQPWNYRAALTRPELLSRWEEVWGAPALDNNAVGELLGYPSCCRAFFEDAWVRAGQVDTTWNMACNTSNACVQRREWERGVELKIAAAGSPLQSNIMLRWLGVRLVPHLPCAFDCPATLRDALAYEEIARERGLQRELAWVHEMLSWPVEWSALHGIAEIRTPILTIAARTDATAGKCTVQREGTSYPQEGAQGLRFPFRIVKGKVTEKPSYQRAQVPTWALNGFSSEAAMLDAHDTLVRTLPTDALNPRRSILDLGCGTGEFLERCKRAGWDVKGLEIDNVRAGAAKIPVRRASLFDVDAWNDQYGVVAFMPGRLLEGASIEECERVRTALRERADYVLFYAYGDWLAKYEDIGVLIAEAGLGDGDEVLHSVSNGVAAALVEFSGT